MDPAAMTDNLQLAVQRNLLFFRREMNNGIIIRTPVSSRTFQSYVTEEVWAQTQCLCVDDPERAIKIAEQFIDQYKGVKDDSVPYAYPTIHFGESIFSGMLGAKLKFTGGRDHTASGAEPLLTDWSMLKDLSLDESNYWIKKYFYFLIKAVEHAGGRYPIRLFITIDALNLVVELRGSTQAYLDVSLFQEKLKQLMRFGVDMNVWFADRQYELIRRNNVKAVRDPDFESLANAPILSVDAYNLCRPDVYTELGLEYQQEFIKRMGRARMHTHGTGLMELLPLIVKLDGLVDVELGRDLHSNSTIDILPMLLRIREMSGDIPLGVELSKEEFLHGIACHMIPSGVSCSVACDSVDEANRIAEQGRLYRP